MHKEALRLQEKPEKAKEAQTSPGNAREVPGSPERPREAQRGPGKPREAKGNPEKPRETQRGPGKPEKPIEAQRGDEQENEEGNQAKTSKPGRLLGAPGLAFNV